MSALDFPSHSDWVRILDLERQLESARSLAVDRDQRLAYIAEILGDRELWNQGSRPRVVMALRDMTNAARGEENG